MSNFLGNPSGCSQKVNFLSVLTQFKNLILVSKVNYCFHKDKKLSKIQIQSKLSYLKIDKYYQFDPYLSSSRKFCIRFEEKIIVVELFENILISNPALKNIYRGIKCCQRQILKYEKI